MSVRVLHVDPATEWRGGQAQLAALLQGRPGDLLAACPTGELARRVRAPDVPLLPGNDPRNALRVRRAALAADLVAAHSSHAHDASLLAPKPLVVHRRNHRPPGSRWKYGRVARIVAVSAYVAELCTSAGLRAPVTVVYDGADGVPRIPRSPRQPPVFGVAAALVAHKGHADLIDSMGAIEGTLLLAGQGPLRRELEARARRFGERVRFLGQLASLRDFFEEIDVLVHPSVEEAAGSVLIEAMACGVPVVARRVGGVPELLGDVGVLAELAPDWPGALRRALAVEPAALLAQAARFGTARMVEETSRVYEAVAREAKERAPR